MNRDYSSFSGEGVKAFVGKEIEKTNAFGLHTLFLDPSHLSNDHMIVLIAETPDIEHVYLNANHYKIEDDMVYARYNDVLVFCESNPKIKAVTIEVQDISKIERFQPVMDRFQKIQLNLSVKIPSVSKYARRISLKIDDVDFKASNAGVWCWPVASMLTSNSFTSWDEYKNDKVIR